ncbi:methylated-DNA--[protein]-cysteine S-methyltransferase [Pseudoalteromonas sp. MMG013]|uniref:methylated-DNA--[protein]-cysteine S-methyltransferase n=1 Tax=Pseudoalteromonas sp. MMG013 TaxID=2822687 RepID=UPI001B3608B5|nr:methylated-DNA--[protein]-cysteine S-methyltransferase [Pseudoalteromonas sp. MMG013]MBQ4864138.1 methylated-DNA--[protein]-cysteine S-methyltransferase [Pseudoalteromonas sp. MMG013]
MFIDYVNSPLGMIECASSNLGLRHVIFCGDEIKPKNKNHITQTSIQQLTEYFSGMRNAFTVPLDPIGTAFQQQVWASLGVIPFGETRSYLDIAKQVDRPKGAQAVGGANGRNPISIIVPCHRVVASNGALTGYAGGIERKLWLLEHEGINIKPSNENQQLDIKNVIAKRQSKTQYLK